MRSNPAVLVIGGGISGLSCLWSLHRAGVDAALVEASARPGGVLRTRREGGFVVEAGPHTVLGAEALRRLIAELGLESELVEADPRLPRFVFFDGRLHRAPLGPLALARSGLLSPRAKLRLLREPWIPPLDPPREESVRDFVVRRLGEEVLERLVAPFLSGTSAGDPTALSAEAVFPALVDLERSHGSIIRGALRSGGRARAPREERARWRRVISFRDGLERIPERIVEILGGRVRCRTAVTGLALRAGGIEAVLREEHGGAGVVRPRAIVLATPADEAARLLREIAPGAARELAAIPSVPLASVSFGYAERSVPRRLHGFGFLVPRGQGIRLLGCIWPSSLFPGRAPDEHVALTSFVGGATDPEGAHLDEASLVAAVRQGLERTLGIRALPKILAIERYERAIPQYTLGHRRRADTASAGLARTPGLFLCGNYLRGISVGDCVREARATAETVAATLRENPETAAAKVDFSASRG